MMVTAYGKSRPAGGGATPAECVSSDHKGARLGEKGKEKGRRDPALSLPAGKSALAVPTASEAATAMETAEAATHCMAETSDMGDTYTMLETAAPEMGNTYAATHVAQAIHAVAEAMFEAAVV
jgi:hypothetical protein